MIQKVTCWLLPGHPLNSTHDGIVWVSEESLLRAHTPDQGWMWLFGSVTKCLSFS